MNTRVRPDTFVFASKRKFMRKRARGIYRPFTGRRRRRRRWQFPIANPANRSDSSCRSGVFFFSGARFRLHVRRGRMLRARNDPGAAALGRSKVLISADDLSKSRRVKESVKKCVTRVRKERRKGEKPRRHAATLFVPVSGFDNAAAYNKTSRRPRQTPRYMRSARRRGMSPVTPDVSSWNC